MCLQGIINAYNSCFYKNYKNLDFRLYIHYVTCIIILKRHEAYKITYYACEIFYSLVMQFMSKRDIIIKSICKNN